MDFDDQLQRYFGTADLAAIQPEAMAAGIEHMRVDFGLDKAFEDEADRNSARDFVDMMDRVQGD